MNHHYDCTTFDKNPLYSLGFGLNVIDLRHRLFLTAEFLHVAKKNTWEILWKAH